MRVAGVVTGDKGINAAGERKGNFEPGINLRSKITVFGDGPRGYLSKELIRRRQLLKGKSTQVYETGVKEVFEMPEGRVEKGRVIHTLGYPFSSDAVGGTWIYQMDNNLISVGLVLPLDASNPFADQHRLFQNFKQHPFVRDLLKDGKPIQYGAKVINSGGYYSMPKLCTDGAILIGEAASMVDMMRLKGIHLGMKSGMLAAERIFESLKSGDFSESALSPYENALYESYVGKSLYRVRHFHRALTRGLPRALFHLGLQHVTGGRDRLRYDKRRRMTPVMTASTRSTRYPTCISRERCTARISRPTSRSSTPASVSTRAWKPTGTPATAFVRQRSMRCCPERTAVSCVYR